MKPIKIPENYDYGGIYLTDVCHLACSYCITRHYGSDFGKIKLEKLSPEKWIEGINRLELPGGIPVTLQGGEPFLYKGINQIFENIRHKADILTALPPHINREYFLGFKNMEWHKREAPYPRIRVSYHKGQNDFKKLVDRISTFNDLVSIGIYYLNHPGYDDGELESMKAYAKAAGVELRYKDFLGEYKGKRYGEFLYDGAADGIRKNIQVKCRNTVVPIAPDGTIYRCHSDLYFNRKSLALGHILDKDFVFPEEHLSCANYGLCSECDVKIKTNHMQVFGYTSVHIELPEGDIRHSIKPAEGKPKNG